MEKISQKIEKIASFSIYFRKFYRAPYKKEWILRDWLESLKILFDHIFFGGRRDTLSKKYETIVFKEIMKNFKKETELNEKSIQDLCKTLENLEKPKIPERDIKMVKQILQKLLKKDVNYNLIKYFHNKLENDLEKNIEKVYEELKKIHGIGIKKSTLLLRELCSIFNLEDDIKKLDNKKEVYKYTQPIDTWVFKVSKKLGILGDSAELKDSNWDKNSKRIVDECILFGSSPIKFNEGAWLLGYYFGEKIKIENLLNNLDKVDKIFELIDQIKS